MFFKDKIDIFVFAETKDKYGDVIKEKRFSERIDCIVMDVELDMKDVAMVERHVRVIANKALSRDMYFYYDGDFFRVINRIKAKDKYSMLAKREVDV